MVLVGLVAGPASSLDGTGFVPINDLGPAVYLGFQGGLYPGGTNELPGPHNEAVLAAGRSIRPLNAVGQPDPFGRVGMVAVGMSNTNQSFKVFERDFDENPDRNGNLLVVNGAMGGQTADEITDPEAEYWDILSDRLLAAGLTPYQVQVVWLHQVRAVPETPIFPDHAESLRDELRSIVRTLKDRYPNLRLCYLSSRIYAGYSNRVYDGEPFSYESGFAMKWLIEDQITGDPALNFDPSRGEIEAPVLLWGPYLWADGATPRSDGLTWPEENFDGGGVHPSSTGERKVGDMLLDFFGSHPSTRPWTRRSRTTELHWIPVQADASVSQAVPNVNLGDHSVLRTAGWPRWARTYLRVDLGGVRRTVHQAKLSLRTDTEIEGEIYLIDDSSWDESTITFNNAPPIGAGAAPGGGQVSEPPTASITPYDRDGSAAADLTQAVRSDRDGLISLVLATEVVGVQKFFSRETGAGPVLILTTTTSQATLTAGKDETQGAVTLQWTDTEDAGYRILRAEGPRPADFDLAEISLSGALEFADVGALDDTLSYFYRVEPVDP